MDANQHILVSIFLPLISFISSFLIMPVMARSISPLLYLAVSS